MAGSPSPAMAEHRDWDHHDRHAWHRGHHDGDWNRGRAYYAPYQSYFVAPYYGYSYPSYGYSYPYYAPYSGYVYPGYGLGYQGQNFSFWLGR
jgi:hypothetical protein